MRETKTLRWRTASAHECSLRGRGRSYRATLGGSVKQGSTIIAHLIGEDYAFFSRISGEKLGGSGRFDSLKNRAEIMKAFRESYD